MQCSVVSHTRKMPSSSIIHILPSDAAKERFPNNHAAQYSIPIDDEQQLTGQWEVAMVQLSHSNCLYTFNGEVIDIGEPRTKAFQCDTGCRVTIPRWFTKDRQSTVKFIVNYLNRACKKILKLTAASEDYIHLKREVTPGWVVCLSHSLKHEWGSIGNALTSDDNYTEDYHARNVAFNYRKGDFYVDLVPTNDKTLVKNIVLKAKNSDMTIDTLVNKFNFLLQVNGEKVAKLVTTPSGHIIIDKLKDDDLVLVCSKAFHQFLAHRTAAVHGKYDSRFVSHNYSNQFDKEWSVALYKKNTNPVGGHHFKSKVLSPRSFTSTDEAVRYLNDVVDDSRIHFKIRERMLSLTVGGRKIVMQMDNTLRDILGFDQNRFESGHTVKATAPLSLTRRINYFQIYSNIGINIRVGDTEAPLLTILPYNPKQCSILSERHFKTLHYVDLKSNYIPQIDIAIYDDAGALVPFHKDAVTSITLHFRTKD